MFETFQADTSTEIGFGTGIENLQLQIKTNGSNFLLTNIFYITLFIKSIKIQLK